MPCYKYWEYLNSEITEKRNTQESCVNVFEISKFKRENLRNKQNYTITIQQKSHTHDLYLEPKTDTLTHFLYTLTLPNTIKLSQTPGVNYFDGKLRLVFRCSCIPFSHRLPDKLSRIEMLCRKNTFSIVRQQDSELSDFLSFI